MNANPQKTVPIKLDRTEKVVIGFVIGYAAMTIFAAGYLAGLLSTGWTAGLTTVF